VVHVPSPPRVVRAPDCDHKLGGMCLTDDEVREAILAEARHEANKQVPMGQPVVSDVPMGLPV
jgi:hypothetical protein